MQPTPEQGTTSNSNSTTRGGGGGEMSRAGGLARFRSAPAVWLEALLEEDDEDQLKPNQSLTQLLATDSPQQMFELGGLSRLNSSPAHFMGNSDIGSDGYLSNFGIPYDYLSELSTETKLNRDAPAQFPPPKFSPHHLKQDHGESQSAISGLVDLDMDKLLEDSVPCRVRAKRGCATHPRSIAERVRRTRISDRIRKLQELVPNMDKQTNTADMLDEAVEYVKYLQKQIQELSEQQRKCICTKE